MDISKKVLTTAELLDIIEYQWSEDESDGLNLSAAKEVNVIIVPPDGEISDTEDLDDDFIIINDNNDLPNEIAGSFDIECVYDDETILTNKGAIDEKETDEPVASTSEQPNKRPRTTFVPIQSKWSTAANYKFEKEPYNDELNAQKIIYEKIGMFFFTFII